ncbi:DNA primase [Alkalispirillum mobile]|uniref:DNA primase n=1 Tax=Alkalispirillum mobile TaxID=85925 RepID=A0A498BX24_9GAMM|nr:DNA primase [Alkalispirillum mobile]RLK48224.1 DNA primase [Alkalispirillum mobile]
MAGRIPDEFIDELLHRTDISEVVGARVRLKKTGANLLGLCPFHTEKTPSFTVAPAKQFYHCFGCGAHGTAIRFLMDYERMDFREAVEYLARQAGMELPASAAATPVPDRHARLYEVLAEAAAFYQDALRRHPARSKAVEYLKQRGLSGDIAARFALGFSPPGWDNLLKRHRDRQADLVEAGLLIERDGGRVYDRFRDRIMFPIRNRRGTVVGFGGRVLGDGEPKYLNSPETPVFHKGRELYGLYEAVQAERNPPLLLVVEGYMDVVALAQHGVQGAVATLGTAVTPDQVSRLFRATDRVVFCFDGDRAGRQAAWRAVENSLPAMREGRSVEILLLPEGEDPDSLVRAEGPEAFRGRLEAETRPLAEYSLEALAEGLKPDTVDDRARLVQRALPLVQRLPVGIYRDFYIEKLAELAHTRVERIEQALQQSSAGAREPARPPMERPRTAGRGRTGSAMVRRTPVRQALTLLLQRPALAEQAGPLDELHGDLPGLELLRQILEIARDHPDVSTAGLLQRFQGHPQETALWRLATWELPGGDVAAEFEDCMGRVRQACSSEQTSQLRAALTEEHDFDAAKDKLRVLMQRRRLQYLQEKSKRGALDERESRELQTLEQGQL